MTKTKPSKRFANNDKKKEGEMKKLESKPLPIQEKLKCAHEKNLSDECLEMFNALVPGQADTYEFESKEEAMNYKSLLHTIAKYRFSESGHLCTDRHNNVMTIYLVDPKPIKHVDY